MGPAPRLVGRGADDHRGDGAVPRRCRSGQLRPLRAAARHGGDHLVASRHAADAPSPPASPSASPSSAGRAGCSASCRRASASACTVAGATSCLVAAAAAHGRHDGLLRTSRPLLGVERHQQPRLRVRRHRPLVGRSARAWHRSPDSSRSTRLLIVADRRRCRRPRSPPSDAGQLPADIDLWLWVASGLAAWAAGLRFFGHYWLQVVPPLVLLAVPVVATVDRSGAHRGVRRHRRARSRWRGCCCSCPGRSTTDPTRRRWRTTSTLTRRQPIASSCGARIPEVLVAADRLPAGALGAHRLRRRPLRAAATTRRRRCPAPCRAPARSCSTRWPHTRRQLILDTSTSTRARLRATTRRR